MACHQKAPSQYVNQFWLIINQVSWHSPEENYTWNVRDISWKIAHLRLQLYLLRGQWVKISNGTLDLDYQYTISFLNPRCNPWALTWELGFCCLTEGLVQYDHSKNNTEFSTWFCFNFFKQLLIMHIYTSLSRVGIEDAVVCRLFFG